MNAISQVGDDINSYGVAGKGSGRGARVLLLAPDDRLRRSQAHLLRAYGHSVAPCATLDDLFANDCRAADCLSVDLHGLAMTPGECLLAIRSREIELPLIILCTQLSDGYRGGPRTLTSGGSPAFLLWQPVDVDLYLTTIGSITKRG